MYYSGIEWWLSVEEGELGQHLPLQEFLHWACLASEELTHAPIEGKIEATITQRASLDPQY